MRSLFDGVLLSAKHATLTIQTTFSILCPIPCLRYCIGKFFLIRNEIYRRDMLLKSIVKKGRLHLR